MAITAIAGFGQGNTNGLVTGNTASRVWNSALGTLGTDIQIIAGAAFAGAPFGLRVSGANHWVRWDSNTIGAGATAIVCAGWFRVSTDPGGLKETHVFDLTNAGSDFASFDYDPSTNRLRAFINASNQDSTLTYAPGVDMYLEFCYNIASGTHSLQWRIDGVDQTTVTLSQAADTFTGFILGDSSSGTTGAFDYGHIVVSTTAADYPLGQHKVERLTVDPADTVSLSGTAADFQTFSGTTPTKVAWNATTARNAVDEVPPNVTTAQDGWCQITTAATNYVQMPMTTYTLAAGETIAAARVLAAVWVQDATSGFLGIRSFNGTTETNLFGAAIAITGNNTASIPWVAEMLTLADINTQGELDALAIRAGFSSDAAPDIGLHAVYVEVAIFVGNAVAAPAVVAVVGGVGAAHPNVGAGPAVAAAVVAIPQATPLTPSGNATATPATVAATVALARPGGNVGAGPVTVATAAALARPAGSVGAGPAVLAAVVAVPRPAGNAGASPAVFAAVVAAGAAHPNVTAVPGVLAAVVAIPAPTVLAGGSATGAPAVLAVVVAVPRPLVNVRAGPALVAAVVVVPRPLVGTSRVVASVVAVAALARPGASVGAGPSAWAALVALARPGVAVAAVPGVVLATVAVPPPAVVAAQSVTALPDTVAVMVDMLATAAGVLNEIGPAIMSGVDRAGNALDATDTAGGGLLGTDVRAVILAEI